MIYLDTHVIVWLYDKRVELFTKQGIELIEKSELFISPIVKLELQYLYEIKRIKNRPSEIIDELVDKIDLKICSKKFEKIVNLSIKEDWTRDPFDRLIVSNAKIEDNILLTRDRKILSNYQNAKW